MERKTDSEGKYLEIDAIVAYWDNWRGKTFTGKIVSFTAKKVRIQPARDSASKLGTLKFPYQILLIKG